MKMNRGSEGFLERIRFRGELAKAVIAEVVTDSAQRLGRRDDPARDAIAEALASLRSLHHEVALAIQRVEALAKEYEQHVRTEHEVVVVTRPPHAGGA